MTKPNTAPHMTQVREQLLATLADLRNREQPMEVDRARAVASVASVLVDTARVEVDYLKATGAHHSDFLETAPLQITTCDQQSLPNGIASITRHHLVG